MSENNRVKVVIANFRAAVMTLEKFMALPITNDRDRAGIIQAFEFCYELAWNTIKKIAEEKGLEAPTPLEAFQVGFQIGLIKPEEQQTWLEMKKTRNLTTHTYREKLAQEVLVKIRDFYLQAFQSLSMRL